MKLNYTSEKTFKSEWLDFPDNQFLLSKFIYDECRKFELTPLMVSQDKKSIVFCVNLSEERNDGEVYRIRIDKVDQSFQ